MKVDKILVSNPFKGNQALKKGVAILTVTAGSLYAASKKDGVNPSEAVNEYYKNEFELRNKDYSLKGLSRFSPEEKLDILNKAEDIKLFSKAFSRIINAKYEDKTPRFNGSEALKLFEDAAENIEKYPNIFKKILEEKDSNDKPRFNTSDCALLMGNAEAIYNYPEAFNSVLTLKNLSAYDCLNVVYSVGEKIEENPAILQEALLSSDKLDGAKKLIQKINSIYAQKEEALQKAEAEKQELLEAEARKKEDEKAQIEKEKRIQAEAAARQRAEEKANQLAEEKRIKQEKMDAWDKQIGWISADCIFEKVNTAKVNKTPLVLENGDVFPDEMVEKAAKHIQKYPTKARNLINARYDNLQPMFNEKECLNILSEMDKYFYVTDIKHMKFIDENGKPFFTSEQCKELLQVKDYYRDSDIGRFMQKERKYSAQEIIELVQNSDITNNAYWYPYDKFANEKNEQSEYKYTVSEAIELAKNNRRKEINLSTF